MFAQAMGVYFPARPHSSRFGLACPDGVGQRARPPCREPWSPWSGATGFFFRSVPSSRVYLGVCCDCRPSAAEPSADDGATSLHHRAASPQA